MIPFLVVLLTYVCSLHSLAFPVTTGTPFIGGRVLEWGIRRIEIGVTNRFVSDSPSRRPVALAAAFI